MTNREKLGLNTASEIIEYATKRSMKPCETCPLYDSNTHSCKDIIQDLCRKKVARWLDKEYHDESTEFIKENKDKIIAVQKGLDKMCNDFNICDDCPIYKKYGRVEDCFIHYIELVAQGEIK